MTVERVPMLQFAVENFGCFAEGAVLSFLALPGETHPEGRTVEIPGVGPVLRSAIQYGANASGKATVLRALFAPCQLATGGARAGAFGRGHSGAPHGGPGRLASCPERDRSGSSEPILDHRERITLGPALARSSQRLAFFQHVAEGTHPVQPFLAELRAQGATELEAVFAFFEGWRESTPDPSESPVATFTFVHAGARRASHADAGMGIEFLDLRASDPAIQERLDGSERIPYAEAAKLGARAICSNTAMPREERPR